MTGALAGGRAAVRAAPPPVSRRLAVSLGAVLIGLAALAWLLTVRQARSMSDMALGLGQVGARMPADMTAPVFMAMWLAMMSAMMLPTVLPMVLAHRRVVLHRGEGYGPTAAFVAGYLAVWAAAGLVPLATVLAFRTLSSEAASSRWLPALAGFVLVAAGAYQFSRWKSLCLGTCRSPLAFVLSHDFGGGARSAFRAGLSHGGYCLGCCWSLMAVLVVVGLMNLVWMAVLAVVFLAEKNWRHGVELSRAVGLGLLLLGLAVVVVPDLLPAVSGTGGRLAG